MRVCRLFALLLIAAATAGCAGMPMPGPEIAAAPAEAPPPDLDNFIYGRSAAVVREPIVPVAAAVAVPANRGVVADGPYSLILDQVAKGVAVRMGVLFLLAGSKVGEPA